ncbi:MAG: hypothetical protein H6702_17425 [Myxococcales bacterium]|nr:hypothetical protein [Myxococcales bacterium]
MFEPWAAEPRPYRADPWQVALRTLVVLDRAVPALSEGLADAVAYVDGAAAAESLHRMTRLIRAAEAAVRLAGTAPPRTVHPEVARALTATVARLGALGALWVPGPLVPLRDRLRRAVAELTVSHARLDEALRHRCPSRQQPWLPLRAAS